MKQLLAYTSMVGIFTLRPAELEMPSFGDPARPARNIQIDQSKPSHDKGQAYEWRCSSIGVQPAFRNTTPCKNATIQATRSANWRCSGLVDRNFLLESSLQLLQMSWNERQIDMEENHADGMPRHAELE